MELHYFDTLPSTNDVALAAAREGAAEFYTVAAHRQSAGQGRLERSFFSPEGGTYFSTVLRPAGEIKDLGAITPFAALAVHRAILKKTGVTTEIKWVNDLLLGGKKVCGILAKSSIDARGRRFVILGIGVNTAPVAFPPTLAPHVAVIPYEDKTALIEAILSELAPYQEEIKTGAWRAPYRAHAAFLDQDILLIKGDGSRRARALDILFDGSLLVRFENGEEAAISGGEISLRAAQPYGNRHNL